MNALVSRFAIAALLLACAAASVSAARASAAEPGGLPPQGCGEAKLVAGDAAERDEFGWSVAISGDTAIVGARAGDNDSLLDTGAAYVFVLNGNAWAQQAKLVASDASTHDAFGYSVAISGDTAVVGEPVNDPIDAGSAYVFVRQGTVWAQEAKLVALDAAASDWFGYSVSI